MSSSQYKFFSASNLDSELSTSPLLSASNAYLQKQSISFLLEESCGDLEAEKEDMFGETGIFFPYMQNFSQEIQQLEDYCRTHKPDDPMDVFTQTSNISDHDLGCEGDLFKAPEAVVEEPILTIDPITAAMNMMSSGKDVITSEVFELANFGSLENNQQLIDKAFYDCEKDLIVKPAMDSSLSDIMDIKNVPIVAKTDEGLNQIWEDKVIPDLLFQKSLSSGNLSSMEWMSSSAMTPRLLDFSTLDFGVTCGMRRAYSEGDIQNLGNKNTNQVQSPLDRIIGSCSSEARRQKLSRYRNKKTKRNFGRKIKYACRKALADSQPRIRGRFAKTDESPREVLTDQQI